MSADTLTDAQAEVLRAVRDGEPLRDIGAADSDYWSCWDAHLISHDGITAAGREALAAHEARHEAGDRRG